MQEPSDRVADPHADGSVVDPIDALVPRQRSTTRFAIGFVTLLLVGWSSWAYGSGLITPQPDCCGNGGASPTMLLDSDRREVVVRAMVFNSSGHDIRIDAATVELPGATVRSIRFAPDVDGPLFPVDAAPPPIVVPARQMSAVFVGFTPDVCEIPRGLGASGWGTVTLDLDVADNGWLPSFGRSYTLPDPVVGAGGADLSVLPWDGAPAFDDTDPLDAACALLNRP